MTAAFQHRTTGPADLSGRRCASLSRVLRHRSARPVHRCAGRRLASGFFRSRPAPRARKVAPQVTGTHLESRSYRFVFAPGCVVAPNNPGTISAGPSNTGLFVLGVTDGAKQLGSSLLALANPMNWPTIAYNTVTLKFIGDMANASTANQSLGAYGAGKNVFGLIATEASILLPAALGNRVVVTQTDSVVPVSNVAPIQYTTLPPPGITNDTIVIVDGVPMRYGDAPVGTAFMPGGGVGRVQGGAIGGLMLPSGSTVIQPNGSTAIVPPVQ